MQFSIVCPSRYPSVVSKMRWLMEPRPRSAQKIPRIRGLWEIKHYRDPELGEGAEMGAEKPKSHAFRSLLPISWAVWPACLPALSAAVNKADRKATRQGQTAVLRLRSTSAPLRDLEPPTPRRWKVRYCLPFHSSSGWSEGASSGSMHATVSSFGGYVRPITRKELCLAGERMDDAASIPPHGISWHLGSRIQFAACRKSGPPKAAHRDRSSVTSEGSCGRTTISMRPRRREISTAKCLVMPADVSQRLQARSGLTSAWRDFCLLTS